MRHKTAHGGRADLSRTWVASAPRGAFNARLTGFATYQRQSATFAQSAFQKMLKLSRCDSWSTKDDCNYLNADDANDADGRGFADGLREGRRALSAALYCV